MLARLFCALLIAPCLLTQSVSDELKLVVVLTRHGVRSPTGLMSEYANKNWPDLQKDWGVQCCADLTPRGAQLVTILGAYYRSYYIQKGLLPKTGCPAKDVYIWADNEQRTMGTANALAQGLADGIRDCNIQVNSLPYTSSDCPKDSKDPKVCQRPASKPQDLWFHPLPGLWNKVSADDQKQIQDAADNINSRYDNLFSLYRPQLKALQEVLGCCQGDICKGVSPPCTLLNLPHQATPGQPPKNGNKGDGTALKWGGPFAVGSTASEVFLLEYANKMPCDKVGWGEVLFNSPDCPAPTNFRPENFREMQKIHTAYFQEVQRPRIVAEIQGSNLAKQILTEIRNAVHDPSKSRGKFVVFSGHDTNIANVAALLRLSWRLPDLPDNDSPPAGALVFELYKGQSAHYVRIRYVHQTVEQLRTGATLSLTNPPDWVDVRLPGCPVECPFRRFGPILTRKIRYKFVTEKPTLE